MKRAGIGDRLGQNYHNMELDFRGSYNKARSPLPLCTLYTSTLLRTYRLLTKPGMAAHGGGWERAKSLGHKLESGIEKSTLEQLAWFFADEADAAELFARIHQPKCASCIKGSRTKLKLLMSAMDLSAA